MSDSQTIAARVREVISDQACCSVDSVTDDKTLTKDLDFNSLDRLELTLALEDEFSIELDHGETEVLNTVGEVMAFVAGKVKGGAA